VRAARLHPDVEFVGIAGRDGKDAIQEFVDQYGIEFTTLVDDDGALWRRFGVTGQPAWVFVTADGLARRVLGAPSESELETILTNFPIETT
jgi:peroxiredoxin